MKTYAKSIAIYVIIFLFIVSVLIAAQLQNPVEEKEPYTYTDLLTQIENGEVEKIEISGNAEIPGTGRALVYLEGEAPPPPAEGERPKKAPKVDKYDEMVEIPAIDVFMQYVEPYSSEVEVVTYKSSQPNWFLQFLPVLLVMVVLFFLFMFLMQKMQDSGGGGRISSFGKSKAKLVVDDKNKITFANVAGLEEEKAELEEVIEFLKQPKKFLDIGARIPKGILLVGPPGTGKTYLAKACSGEAGVPFFSISGSDFVEMFVGVGASRVRDLFEQAKKNSPCIIFIDEIDAVGRRRGAGLGGGHDEREQTLNQLLVEMDGFGINEGVIVIAGTNRKDILDPALLRPGRFDRCVEVGIPDVKGREAVLQIHAKTKAIGGDVDFRVVAQTTQGFTPADLENLLNEAALLAARHDKTEVDMEEMRRAFVKIGVGTEKKSRVISEKERRITAYHEAGHAVLFEVLEHIDSTYMVSVIPTGVAGGYTMPLPGEERAHTTKKHLEHSIISLLGGRAAESIVLNDITTGASNDIERATALARAMVMKVGMSEVLGPIQFGDDNDEVFIGRDLAHTRNYGDKVADLIDSEIKRIIQESYDKAVLILNEHVDVLHKIAALLIEKEKVSGDEVRSLFPEGSIQMPEITTFMTSAVEQEAKRKATDAEQEAKEEKAEEPAVKEEIDEVKVEE